MSWSAIHAMPRARCGRPPALWLALVALTCAGTAVARVRVSDDRGVVLSFEQPPARVVSLVPSLTETLCALDACDRLVGTDRFSNWPARVQALPKLGDMDDPHVEQLVKLRPDVILAPRSARTLGRLEALGLKVLVLESQTYTDVRRAFGLVALLLGMPDAGPRAWAGIERQLARAAARVPAELRGKTVYFEVATSPYAAGRASFIGETLERLGMGNAVPAELGPFPKLNPEFIVRAQPDIIMAVAREARTMHQRPGWQGLVALRRGRVCGFERDSWDLLLRPGPRIGEAAIAIADCLASLPASPAGLRP
jgi:iron complex transport system substrate-binding protein